MNERRIERTTRFLRSVHQELERQDARARQARLLEPGARGGASSSPGGIHPGLRA